MAENKTKGNDASVTDFLAGVENVTRRTDAQTVVDMMTRITGKPAKMWGDTIVGFDTYHYKYDSGREGDSPITGVSPRKANLTIYIMPGFDKYTHITARLGKFKTSVSCLKITNLKNIDLDVLEELITISVADMRARYPR